jgi:hypothetical protein
MAPKTFTSPRKHSMFRVLNSQTKLMYGRMHCPVHLMVNLKRWARMFCMENLQTCSSTNLVIWIQSPPYQRKRPLRCCECQHLDYRQLPSVWHASEHVGSCSLCDNNIVANPGLVSFRAISGGTNPGIISWGISLSKRCRYLIQLG